MKLAALSVVICLGGIAAADSVRTTVEPKTVDAHVTGGLEPHVVAYDPQVADAELLVFLPGTGGHPEAGPKHFYDTVIEQHYRLISLSYIDDQAIAQICPGQRDASCSIKVRTKRTFGDDTTDLIADTPADAIVTRLAELLAYLAKTQPNAGWDAYLDHGAPRWSRIALAGQSQGGGMAELIAKRDAVARVLTFSGGWDSGADAKDVAGWYSDKSVTPAERWFGTYNVAEEHAKAIARTYKALGIPAEHVFALDKPVPDGANPHPQGVVNPAYKPIWVEMLGDGRSR
jgi:hypothetical protein